METLLLRLINTCSRAAVDFVAKPASPRPLAVLRIGLAAALLCQAFAFAANLLDLYGSRGIVQWNVLPTGLAPETPSLGMVRGWLEPLGVDADTSVRLVFYAYVASLVCMLLGWHSRTSAIVAWLTQMALKTTGIAAIYGVDEYAHIALFYCVWMPIGSVWSLDRQAGRASDQPTAMARLSLRVLQLHLCISYFASGVEKASGEQWQTGEAIWRALMRPDLGMFDMSWLASYPTVAMLLCWSTLVVEIGYAFMIWNRWTRLPWALATIGLHVGIGIFMGLWSFAAVMIVLNVAALIVRAEPPPAPAVKTDAKGAKKPAVAVP